MSLSSATRVTPGGLSVAVDLSPTRARDALEQIWERGEEGIERADGVFILTYPVTWALPDGVLAKLGIQRYRTPLPIREAGIPGRSRYSWSLGWPAGSRVDGCWLHGPAGVTLLPPELLELQQLQQRVAGANKSTVFRAILRLQALARSCTLIRLPSRIADSRIREAGALRIEIEGAPEEPRPVPRLVGPREPSEVETDREPEGVDLEVPLGAVLDDIVGRSADDSVISLGRRDYLVVPKGVFQNLVLTAAASQQPAKVRARFIENPTAFLPDPDTFDDAHYSARVIGVREAPRPTVGVQAESRSWAEPSDGLLIQCPTGPIWVPGESLARLSGLLQTAVTSGDPAVDWEGHMIPARPEVAQAIARAAAPAVGDGDEFDEPPQRPRVLRIQENEVVLDWAPVVRGGRRAPASDELALASGVTLKPHQEHALARLKDLWVRGETGALLCDDMGLGKTIQALVFAAWVHKQIAAGGGARVGEGVTLPVMIVGPPSLLEGWLSELNQRFPPECLPRILWGAGDLPGVRHGRQIMLLKRFRLPRKQRSGSNVVLEHARLDLNAIRDFAPDVLFIGYDTLRSLQFAVGELRVGLVIADEAQQVKNPGSLRSHALRAMNYDFALALTGTPIENSWTDLWTLCDFAAPGLLGTLTEFRRAFPSSDGVRDIGKRLATAMRDVMIRRTRSGALKGLPPCDVRSVERQMSPDQALAYRAEVARSSGGGQAILGLLQGLARVSLHPKLRAEITSHAQAVSWLRGSARTSALYEHLYRWREEEEPALVFVRSLAAQATLSRALQVSFGLPTVEVLNGQISLPERQRVVQRMAKGSGFRILLVSPDVGGAGWNLQFAARSFLLERPFNPAIEAQMIARTWRLGQSRPVEVVAPVALLEGIETFDEVLDQLLRDKRELAESVLAPAVIQNEEIVKRFSSLLL